MQVFRTFIITNLFFALFSAHFFAFYSEFNCIFVGAKPSFLRRKPHNLYIMGKEISLPFINVTSDQQANSIIASAGAHGSLSEVNWQEQYPYKPQVDFHMAHDNSKLYVLFEVREDCTSARWLNDCENVWEDSCVELFLQVPGSEHYFNFENNCIGTKLAAKRRSASDFVMFSPEQMAQITCISSLPHKAVEINEKDFAWSLFLAVPFALLGLDHCPKKLKGSLYKCGDNTAITHFVSWTKIPTPTPCFHAPHTFGEINLLSDMDQKIYNIATQFDIKGEISEIKAFGGGLINDTFKVATTGDAPDYLLQRKNHIIFPDIDGMMSNIDKVTTHLRAKVAAAGGNPDREVLTPVRTRDGKLYVRTDDGNFYAMSVFINDSVTIDVADSLDLCFKGGAAIGKFHAMLADFTEPLVETIKGFHNIRWRFTQWDEALALDKAGRKAELAEEISWIESRRKQMLDFWSLVEEGKIPRKVTHNDTKLSNVLFDKDGNVLCVIDLDTLMSSTVLNDFGDAIRSYTNTGAEDDKNLDNVSMDLSRFEAYAKGFLSVEKDTLNSYELEYLAFSGLYITFEQVLRFLMDYIDGDTYYKVQYPTHNLVRTHAQYKLLQSMEAQYEAMKKVVLG